MIRVTRCDACGMPTVSTGETEFERGYRAGMKEAAEEIDAFCRSEFAKCCDDRWGDDSPTVLKEAARRVRTRKG